ncbi:MAG TPA: type IX secretion system protein PorQ [Brumimicrobium sp.]|nr:type IX secretion system protein PorQ [Brumimicrobium sp.]
MRNFIYILLIFPFIVYSQTGGKHAFPFLDLPDNARAMGLGKRVITVFDDDIHLGIQNPAAFNSKMHNSIGFNHALLAGGINHGMIAYARDINKVGTGAIHLRYISYGKMDRRDETGEHLGTFTAGDFALGASLGRTINDHLSIGANVNFIWSQLESYSSMGVAVDVAGMFRTKDEMTVVSAVVKNIGAQLKTYHDNNRYALPIDAMLGVSHRLKHAPFRFSLVLHQLNRWNLSYFDPEEKPKNDPLTGELIPVKRAGFGENLARHMVFQVESIIGKMVRVRLAFDYNQRKEMLVKNRPGMGGFSFGAGMNFKRFAIDYGISIYSSAGFHNMIGLRTNFDSWRKADNR